MTKKAAKAGSRAGAGKPVRKRKAARKKPARKKAASKAEEEEPARPPVSPSPEAADPEGSVVADGLEPWDAPEDEAERPGNEEAEEDGVEVIPPSMRRRPIGGSHLGSIRGCPAAEVEFRPIAEIRPYQNNPREHSPEQVAAIKASMERWGWTMPLLVDEKGVLIAGHGRLLAARELGATEAPVIYAIGWSAAEKRAYVIADNQLALSSTWNSDILAVELTALEKAEFDLDLLGFEDADLRSFYRGDEGGGGRTPTSSASLAERFGAVPFSVLNAREGWWQERKRAWLALGIQSEIGRVPKDE